MAATDRPSRYGTQRKLKGRLWYSAQEKDTHPSLTGREMQKRALPSCQDLSLDTLNFALGDMLRTGVVSSVDEHAGKQRFGTGQFLNRTALFPAIQVSHSTGSNMRAGITCRRLDDTLSSHTSATTLSATKYLTMCAPARKHPEYPETVDKASIRIDESTSCLNVGMPHLGPNTRRCLRQAHGGTFKSCEVTADAANWAGLRYMIYSY